MKTPLMIAASLLLAAPAGASWFRPGANATVGSAGYHRTAVTAEGGWKADGFDPYIFTEAASDTYQNTVTATAGASKALDTTVRVRAGAGVLLSRVRGTDGGAGSGILELGADKDLGPGTVLGGYSLTAGRVAATSYARNKKGRTTPTLRTQSASYHALSAGYRLPLEGFALIFRETVGFASYADRALYTTAVTASVPLGPAKAWNVSTTLSADVGASQGFYAGAGLSDLFE